MIRGVLQLALLLGALLFVVAYAEERGGYSNPSVLMLPASSQAFRDLEQSVGSHHRGYSAALLTLNRKRSHHDIHVMLLGAGNSEGKEKFLESLVRPNEIISDSNRITEYSFLTPVRHLGLGNTALKFIDVPKLVGTAESVCRDSEIITGLDSYLKKHSELKTALPNAVLMFVPAREVKSGTDKIDILDFLPMLFQNVTLFKKKIFDRNFNNAVFVGNPAQNVSISEDFQEALRDKFPGSEAHGVVPRSGNGNIRSDILKKLYESLSQDQLGLGVVGEFYSLNSGKAHASSISSNEIPNGCLYYSALREINSRIDSEIEATTTEISVAERVISNLTLQHAQIEEGNTKKQNLIVGLLEKIENQTELQKASLADLARKFIEERALNSNRTMDTLARWDYQNELSTSNTASILTLLTELREEKKNQSKSILAQLDHALIQIQSRMDAFSNTSDTMSTTLEHQRNQEVNKTAQLVDFIAMSRQEYLGVNAALNASLVQERAHFDNVTTALKSTLAQERAFHNDQILRSLTQIRENLAHFNKEVDNHDALIMKKLETEGATSQGATTNWATVLEAQKEQQRQCYDDIKDTREFFQGIIAQKEEIIKGLTNLP